MLVTVVEVPNIWCIKIHGLLNQPQPQNLGVEIYVALWIARDGSDMVNAVGLDCHIQSNRAGRRFISNGIQLSPDYELVRQ